MRTYISLIRWTEKGIQSVKAAPTRIDDAKAMFRAAGAEIKGVLPRHGAVRHGRDFRSPE